MIFERTLINSLYVWTYTPLDILEEVRAADEVLMTTESPVVGAEPLVSTCPRRTRFQNLDQLIRIWLWPLGRGSQRGGSALHGETFNRT